MNAEVISLQKFKRREDIRATKDKLEIILSQSEPGRLVQNMAPEDFVIMVKNLGEQDAHALIELCS